MLASVLRASHPATRAKLTVLAAAILCSAAVLLLVAAHAASAAGKPAISEYVVLIDTSKSMAGYNGAKNIFPDVKKAVNEFVGGLDPQSVVYVYTFDSGLTKRPGIQVLTKGDKARVQAIVNGLTADGMTTAIYNSLSGTLTEMQRVRRRNPGKTHLQNILLFTDGRDNQSGMSFNEIARQFELARGENPNLYLTYVTLGTTADPRWGTIDGVEVKRNPPKLVVYSIRVKPADLDFGSLFDVDTSERMVEITFDKGLQGATMGLSAASHSVEKGGGLISVEPRTLELRGSPDAYGSLVMTQALTLTVQNRDSLNQSATYTGQIDLTLPSGKAIVTWSPKSLALRFTLAAQPQVTIEAPGGTLDGRLGTLDPYAGDDAKAQATRSVTAVFNSTAETAGTTVSVRLQPKTGADAGVATLQGADGPAPDGVLELTAEQPTCSVVVHVDKGQAAGHYTYGLQFEPSAGASLSGLPIDSATGKAVLPISFTVPAAPLPPPPPPPPTPLIVVVLRWLAIAAVAVVVLAVIAFIALCLLTGSGLGVMWGLLRRKRKPTLRDARVEVTAPVDAAKQYELSGQKLFDLGPEQIPTMPFVVRFEPNISILNGKDEAVVRAHPKDDQSFFTILRATTGIDETLNDSTVATGDVIKVDGTNGERCELVFRSFDYVNA